MKNKEIMEDKEGLSSEVIVGVTFASLMGAITLFFTGILIAEFHSFDSTIRVPLLYLIIATFSYIFAASIYSNAGVEVTVNNHHKVKNYLIYANNIFEFLGLYLLTLATPLVIGAVTEDSFLRVATIIVGLCGLALYSSSNFSILSKELRSRRQRHIVTATIIVLAVIMYFSQYFEQLNKAFAFNYVATALLITVGIITVIFCRRSNQYIVE